MRVISGKYKGRRILPPKGMEARPTTDYAREGLFNILRHNEPLEGIDVLDLFAGTGSVSLEFLSNGARRVVSVEQDKALCDHIQRTAVQLNETSWQVIRGDVMAVIGSLRGSFDIVFCDPPFTSAITDQLPERILSSGLLVQDGLLVVEHSERLDLSALPGFEHRRAYGSVHFSFFRPEGHAT
ncbi:MAG: 16S rRNA (guanine(966)-N(2))-methyltransferase RsmD [Flavobacteriales bacterium]|nr:16S rRNA (guanine(966)-N(2))-methyltransferase RsmD [Flavobacteriales bacterium]